MTMNGQQTRFRDDLRKLLLLYALVPLLGAVIALFGFLGYIPLKNVVHGTTDDLRLAGGVFAQQWQSMEEELLAIQRMLDLPTFRSSIAYQASVKEDIYQYINNNEARPQFFLLNADEQLIFSTQSNPSVRESVQNSLHWRLVNNLPAAPGKVASAVVRAEVGVSTISYMLIGCRLFEEDGQSAGYACFALGESQMHSLLKQCASSFIVTDRFDSVFLGMDSAFIGEFGKLRGDLCGANGFKALREGLFYIRCETAQSGLLQIYAMSECGSILSTLLLLAVLVLILFGAFALIILASTERVADQKTRIIDEIASACHQVQQGDLNTELSISSNDEFQIIAQAYNSMLCSMRELISRSVELGHETAVSKVRQLESQFNPHFLFNTLENVRFMIRMNPKGADRALVNLSSLLRYSIHNSGMIIPLREDLAYVRSYMEILEMRFGERLRYHVDVPEALEAFPVPKLIMQPIIENAAKYGMRRDGELCVELCAYFEGEQVILRVRDNGQGIEPDMLKRLEGCLAGDTEERGEHFGIMNVHERIRLMYGDAYGISIETQAGEGTAVLLHFPRNCDRGGEKT